MLHKKMEFCLDNVTNVLKAATILHNICIANGDENEIDWNAPHTIYPKHGVGITTNVGLDIRNALSQYFIQNPL